MVEISLVLLFLCVSTALGEHISSTWTCNITKGPRPMDAERERSCVLENVCYRKGKYVFYHDGKSELPPTPLVELGVYPNSLALELVGKKAKVPGRSVRWVNETSILYDRCCAHNYFHGLMDAYIGVHWMIQHWSAETARNLDHRFFWTDDKLYHQNPTWFNSMAETMTKHPQEFIREQQQTLCWKRLVVGPSGHQLGGPGQSLMGKEDIVQYRRFLLRALRLKEKKKEGPLRITLVNRPLGSHRRILNEEQVVAALSNISTTSSGHRVRSTPIVDVVTWEKAKFRDQAKQVLSSNILISMHGAAMANMMFLPRRGAVVEVFTYNMQRPLYRTISGKQGIRYLFWGNQNKKDTVFHPEQLAHLPQDQQEDIIKDPKSISRSMVANKYWLDQDTVIGDMEGFIQIVREALDTAYR